MNHFRFVGLLLGVLLVFYGLFWLFEHHVLALAVSIKSVGLALFKKLGTRAFWEHVPLVMGKWGLKSLLKFIVIQLPKTLLLAFIFMLAGPRARRWTRVQLWYFTHRTHRYFDTFRSWCDNYFGRHGVAAFFLSLVATLVILLSSIVFLGFELVFWLGKWGPIGRFFTWLTSALARFVYGTVHTIPFLGRVIAWCRSVWEQTIAPRFPRIAAFHRRFVRKVLWLARRSRLITTDARVRMLHRVRKRSRKEK